MIILILILIALIAFVVGAVYFIRGIFALCKAGYYYWFANEKQLDKQIQKVWSNGLDYESFKQKADNSINDILNNQR